MRRISCVMLLVFVTCLMGCSEHNRSVLQFTPPGQVPKVMAITFSGIIMGKHACYIPLNIDKYPGLNSEIIIEVIDKFVLRYPDIKVKNWQIEYAYTIPTHGVQGKTFGIWIFY